MDRWMEGGMDDGGMDRYVDRGVVEWMMIIGMDHRYMATWIDG